MTSPAPTLVTSPLRLIRAEDEARSLCEALKARRPWAERALLEDNTVYVERLLTRILGYDSDLDDLVQDVFVRALERVDDLRDDNVRSWIGAFAVNVAREAIRRRRRRRWLVFLSPEQMPEPVATAASPDVKAAVSALYALLDRMDADDRVVFTLRMVEGLELAEIANLCDVSLSTVKRRVDRAQTWFVAKARRDARLSDWVGEA